MNRYLTRLKRALASATKDISVHQLESRPSVGKWSIAEILEHLNLSYTATVNNFERSLRANKPLGSVPTLKGRLQVALVVGFGYFPSGRDAPNGTIPKGKPGQQVLSEIERNFSTMSAVLQESETRFGTRTFVANHPILGPLTVNQWCKFHWVHGRHHMKQISRQRQITDAND